jgi:outer membrane protein OmpA-like peptidoglycan-associated protein
MVKTQHRPTEIAGHVAIGPSIVDVRDAQNITMFSYERRDRPRWLALCVPVLLPGLFAWGMTNVRTSVEDDLRAKSVAALAGVGADALTVDVEGRDVRLTGTLPAATPLAVAHGAVRSLRGVRHVDDSAVIDPDAEVDPAPTVATTIAPPTTVTVATVAVTTVPVTTVPVTTPVTATPATVGSTAPVTSAPAPTTLPAPTTTAPPPKTLGDLAKLPTIEFGYRSAELTPAGAALVDAVAKVLAANPNKLIRIEGNTDNLGTPAENQLLSEARANKVRSVLIAKGINARRLDATGNGSSKPVASNDTEEGRQKNRRTEFVVLN